MKKIMICILLISVILIVGYHFYIMSQKYYNNDDFSIDTYVSDIDKDGDGIDDQTDILLNAKDYIATHPQYKSKYYNSGYPNDSYGVCTDVVAFSLLAAGYDLMELVNSDMKMHPQDYNVEILDKHIDFRRVRNLKVYFAHTAISLTTDIHKIEQWQGGDIVIFKNHIGIISDKRNKRGIPLVIHHATVLQMQYEEDILEYRNDIIGHYRIS